MLRLVFCTTTRYLLTAITAGNMMMDGAFAVEHAHIKLRKYAARCEANGLDLIKSVAGNFIKIRMNHVAKYILCWKSGKYPSSENPKFLNKI